MHDYERLLPHRRASQWPPSCRCDLWDDDAGSAVQRVMQALTYDPQKPLLPPLSRGEVWWVDDACCFVLCHTCVLLYVDLVWCAVLCGAASYCGVLSSIVLCMCVGIHCVVCCI